MNTSAGIREISDAVLSIDAAKFLSYAEHYLKTSAVRMPGEQDQEKTGFFKKSRSLFTHKEKRLDVCAAIEAEGTEILSRSALSLQYFSGFRFKINGHEADERARLYQRKLRQQQTELLIGISDETEIILNMIRLSLRMRQIVQDHSEIIRKNTYLTDVIGERFSQQSVPRAETDDETESGNREIVKAESEEDEERKQLIGTFRSIRAYEDGFGTRLKPGSAAPSPEQIFAAYHDLVQYSREDIAQRKQKITSEIRELREGWKFLEKLAVKGFSPRMQGGLDLLLGQHDYRRSEFRKYVLECRAEVLKSGHKPCG
ncbi:hypothetical protein QUF80_12490 [Desulfococcaceae bacterium HSG8]|nr:hypothetical protein [Desulfococcaceae bacterium HSG8]